MRFEPNHVALVVSDLERSTSFYEALGFEVVFEHRNDTASQTIRSLRQDGFEIELFCYERSIPPDLGELRLGLRHLAFRVDDLDEATGRLREWGMLGDDVDTLCIPGGPRLLFFRDPDGVEIELTQQ